MTGLALIKVLLLSLSMVGLERLFVVVFLGDSRVGPAIGRIKRRRDVSPATDLKKGKPAVNDQDQCANWPRSRARTQSR